MSRQRFLPGCYLAALLLLAQAACGEAKETLPVSPTRRPLTGTLVRVSPTVQYLTSVPAATSMPGPSPTILAVPASSTQPIVPVAPGQFPDPSKFEWREIVPGLTSPVGLANAGDGSGRLFILEQPGVIRVVQDGILLPDPFLDIRSKVSCCGERGLLGLAFHPDYENNGLFYVNYTDLNGDTVIARFNVSGTPDLADAGSEILVLGVAQPYPNHNGGGMAFGPDGDLYLGLGDGGSGGDPQDNGQNPNVLLGKILRLDVDSGQPYTIPADNPFATGGGAPEVWALGLRNPWRFSFDRLTGDMYIGDVGQGSWEEVDFWPAGSPGGANFGWNYREGTHPYANAADQPAGLNLIDPVAEYGHDQGISVIGGYVYRGSQLPAWQGIYLYGDYGSGSVWGLFRSADSSWQNALLFQTGTSITSFGEDETGEVYFVGGAGSLFRLERQ